MVVVFPQPVRTEEAENFALWDLEADVIDGDEITELLGQAIRFNGIYLIFFFL